MIRIIGQKTLYNMDNKQTMREWAIEPVKKLKTIQTFSLSSGIKVKNNQSANRRAILNALGYILANSNNINENAQGVALFTAPPSHPGSFGINKDNFLRCITLFSARKLIMPNWINSKDEYLAPDESNPKYKEYVNDSVVFSLFHIHANQSSLRNIEYKNKEKNNE